MLGICFGICFVTGMLSYYQYQPWSWLPEPASPVWLYRFTQGLHVATGTATIPLLLVKLWSVYPNLFRWPAVRSLKHAAERLSVFVLVSTALVQLTTGYFNTLNWYPWPWDFVSVHRFLAYVLIGSILLHIGLKLPDIKYGLEAKLATADVLTEIPWSENPLAHSNAGDVPPPPTPALSRRGVLVAGAAGIGAVVVTRSVRPLRRWSRSACSRSVSGRRGRKESRSTRRPNRPASSRRPRPAPGSCESPDRLPTCSAWPISTSSPRRRRTCPITCVKGWSAGARWRGIPLLEVVRRAGGDASSRVRVVSLEQGLYGTSVLEGPQVSAALLATHLNGERLNLDHGYPLRLISPNRAGVLNTKWLTSVEVT